MKTAIILHGMPLKKEYFDPRSLAQSNKHWLSWLQRQLIVNGILAQTPELPEPYKPVYKKWCSVFERFPVDKDTILVGHSCGAGFLVKWLSENKVKANKVALVAPFLDLNHHPLITGFSNFKIDKNMVERTKGLAVFYSTDDSKDILAGVNKLETEVKNIEMKRFTDKKHFCFENMKTKEFPELRDFLLKKD